MSDLTLYHAVPSRGLITRWMLEEIGEPHNVQTLDLARQEHKRSEFLAINPMGRIPALRHGDKIITETAAICFYLAENFPKANLSIAAGTPLRADYLRWMFYAPVSAETAILWQALGEVRSETGYLPFAAIEDVAETLSRAIGDKEFLLDDRFTAVDILVGCTIMWGLNLMRVLPRTSSLVDYWHRLEQRPAWQRAQQADFDYLDRKDEQTFNFTPEEPYAMHGSVH